MNMCVVIALLCLATNPSGKPNQNSNQGNSHTAEQAQTSVVATHNEQTSAQTSHGEKKAQNRDASVWANWVLVAVAILTLLAISYQARETAKATKAMRDSIPLQERTANAAKDAVQTQINAERAWLLIDRGETSDKIQAPHLKPMGHADIAPGKERLSHCIFFVKNHGKTPGKVTVCRSQLQIGNSLESPPDTSIYEAPNSTSSVFFIPQDSSIQQEARLKPSATGFITWEDLEAIEGKVKFLWLCGFLRYEDVFSADGSPRQHETRFCYMWETRMDTPEPYWNLAGPTEYNRTT